MRKLTYWCFSAVLAFIAFVCLRQLLHLWKGVNQSIEPRGSIFEALSLYFGGFAVLLLWFFILTVGCCVVISFIYAKTKRTKNKAIKKFINGVSASIAFVAILFCLMLLHVSWLDYKCFFHEGTMWVKITQFMWETEAYAYIGIFFLSLITLIDSIIAIIKNQ